MSEKRTSPFQNVIDFSWILQKNEILIKMNNCDSALKTQLNYTLEIQLKQNSRERFKILNGKQYTMNMFTNRNQGMVILLRRSNTQRKELYTEQKEIFLLTKV